MLNGGARRGREERESEDRGKFSDSERKDENEAKRKMKNTKGT